MVNKLLLKARSKQTLGIASAIISFSFLISKILGLIRDRLLVSNLTISSSTDAYVAAFKIPDLIFTFIVSGSIAVVFIPVFLNLVDEKKNERANNLINDMLNIMSVVILVVSAVTFIFTGPIIDLFTPGFDEATKSLTIDLTRIMLLTPTLFSISSILGSFLQSQRRFIADALNGIFYNIGIILGIVLVSKLFNNPVYGVAWGVVLGTVIQTCSLLYFSYKENGVTNWSYKPSFNYRSKDFKKIVTLVIPRTLATSTDQVNWLIQTAIASSLAAGSLSAYYFANNLKNVPIGLFAAALSIAAFPKLSEYSSNLKKLKEVYISNLKLMLILVVPSAVISIVLRGYIVRILYGFGNSITANILGFFGILIISQSVIIFTSRVFYALENTKVPFYFSLFAIILNTALSIYLSSRYQIFGMAISLAVVSFLQMTGLLIYINKKVFPLSNADLINFISKIGVSSVSSGVILVFLRNRVFPLKLTDLGIQVLAPKIFILIALYTLIYILINHLFNIHESKYMIAAGHKRFVKYFKLKKIL